MKTMLSRVVLTALVAAALLTTSGTALADPFVGILAETCREGGGTASYGKCVGGAYDGFDTVSFP